MIYNVIGGIREGTESIVEDKQLDQKQDFQICTAFNRKEQVIK
jgi:hypothetical protein